MCSFLSKATVTNNKRNISFQLVPVENNEEKYQSIVENLICHLFSLSMAIAGYVYTIKKFDIH